MKSFRITRKNLSDWQKPLQDFEKHFIYPLGEDSFHIDHGEDYLKFFERMGNAHLFAMEEKNEIIGMGIGVIHQRLKAWYLCDVKVHPEKRGQKIPLKMFRKYFLPCYLKSQRGYALNMESADGKPNPVIKIMENLPWTPFKKGTRLFFYYEDAGPTNKAIEILSAERSSISFSSLKGKKDLIVKSTNSAIPLLHMEWGGIHSNEGAKPIPGQSHMWCLPEEHKLNKELNTAGITHKASGWIYHHRMSHVNWSELRTSEL